MLFWRALSLKTVEVRIDRGGTCWGIRPPALTALAEKLAIFWAIGCNPGGKNVTFSTHLGTIIPIYLNAVAMAIGALVRWHCVSCNSEHREFLCFKTAGC